MKNQEVIIERTKELLSVRCYEGLKEAAEQWLDAVGTEKEKEASRKYVLALEDAVTDIDTLINVFGSEKAKKKSAKKWQTKCMPMRKRSKQKVRSGVTVPHVLRL